MRTQRNEHTDREQRQRKPAPARQQDPRRLNPRLVFSDPDTFFRDLVMEQQEQM